MGPARFSSPPCPANSFRYNSTLCACGPGRFLSRVGARGTCELFSSSSSSSSSSGGGEAGIRSGRPMFLSSVLPFNSIHKLTRSPSGVLEATLVTLALWLFFCLAVRLGKIDGRRTRWYRIRRWISQLDFFFDTHHWLEDHQVVRKRKTELGGTFSVASWISIVGLLSALLYQILTKNRINLHKVRPSNALDLQSFVMDMEFNITTVSSMSCSHLHGLNTLVTGTPGFIDFREYPLSSYLKSECYNSSKGPTVSLKCYSCRILPRNYLISWYFLDLPNDPATAVGFIFNLTANRHGDLREVISVTGSLKPDLSGDNMPATLRGEDVNILKIDMFPLIYDNLHDLKIIHPLFHDFIPGTFFTDEIALRSSLQDPKAGLVNITFYISYLSDRILELGNSSLYGPVSVLADIGGLCTISLAIFLYLLWQFESKIITLRNEDYVMADIRSRRRAQRNWDKLRRYVIYTWGRSNFDRNMSFRRSRRRNFVIDSFRRTGSMKKTKRLNGKDEMKDGQGSSFLALNNAAVSDGRLPFTESAENTMFDIEELSYDRAFTS